MSSSGDEPSGPEQSDRFQFQKYASGAPILEFSGFL